MPHEQLDLSSSAGVRTRRRTDCAGTWRSGTGALVLDEDIPEITGRSFIFEDQIYDVEGLLALVRSATVQVPP
ncbi:hypothetical protein F1643_21670 [Azospirillum sp. INR13]|nr:hypothetical protein [Azospirillum sp. INR13]